MFAVAMRIHTTTSPSTCHRLTDMSWSMYILFCQLEVPAQPELPPLWGDVEFEAWHTLRSCSKVPRVVFHLHGWHHLHFIDLLNNVDAPSWHLQRRGFSRPLATNQTTIVWTAKPCTDVGADSTTDLYSSTCVHNMRTYVVTKPRGRGPVQPTCTCTERVNLCLLPTCTVPVGLLYKVMRGCKVAARPHLHPYLRDSGCALLIPPSTSSRYNGCLWLRQRSEMGFQVVCSLKYIGLPSTYPFLFTVTFLVG